MIASRLGVHRRNFIALSALVAVAAFGPTPALAQGPAGTGNGPARTGNGPAKPEEGPAKVSVDLLLAPQALPDLWLGDAKAPVTMIEYASMTCSHCAAFNVETFPKLKSDYIDKGKVRFVLREFPLDPLAAAGAMLARCSGDKREAVVELLFHTQKSWAFVNNPLDALTATLKQTGMSQAAFEACLNDQALFNKVDAERQVGQTKFGVSATPTFFINGDRHPGEIPPGDLDAVLAPYLK